MTPADLGHFLALAARAAPSADNSQPLDFRWDGRRFAIAFSQSRGAGKLFGPQSHPTLLAVGAAMGNIDAAAEGLGASGSWEIASPAAADSIYGSFLPQALPPGAAQNLELPLFRRHTNRLPYRATALQAEQVEALRQSVSGSARMETLSSGPNRSALVRIVRQAAEVRFQTRELHDWLMGSLRHTLAEAEGGEGLDVRTLHLPPGGHAFLRFTADWRRMAFLNQLGVYKALAASETLLLGAAPLIAAIVAPHTLAGTLDAGRLLARVWSELNAAGLAVHPYYVVTDQLLRLENGTIPPGLTERVLSFKAPLPELLALGPGDFPHILLRVGYPRKTPTLSRRLPLETLYTDLS